MPPSYVATSIISLVVMMAGVITAASASVPSLRGIRSLSTAAFSTYHRRPAVTPPSRGFPFHRNIIKSARTRIPFSRFSAKTMRALSATTMEYDEANKEEGLNGSYEPSSFESEMYDWWERSGCFDPDANIISSSNGSNSADGGKHGGKSPYVLPMPPPNVTGRLHMGHGIFVALQDVLARFHRMRGRPVLWLPGTDHAGIATQLQVEKSLVKEGTTREELGRDAFLERVWEYKAEQGGHITSQLRSLGASADWKRERFTMDDGNTDSVIEAFVRLHEKGLVYRGEYMVNWAPGLKTAVSDLEVDYTEEEGKMYYFKYIVEGGSDDEYLPVATTRPETIPGDECVCVHPDDERFKHLVGKRAIVPGSSGRSVPIIADDYVDMEFGTGALKVTPGHDPNDYIIGKRHNLPITNIMNKDGTMNANAGELYKGLDRNICREKIWEDMGKDNLVIKVEPHVQRVPRSQRGGEVIEPLVSRQWFVKTEGMSEKALNAVEDGTIQIIPKRFEKVWNNWLTDTRDWCVSRQLWWGHRIPVWYIGEDKDAEDEYIVARNENEAREKALSLGHPVDVILRQDPDVLDTWFSSGLWPFASVGWPQKEGDSNSDLERFYPASCLETGYDIIFFWVARMAMMGLELTGKAPFSVVYLHGLVRAEDGSKMSKTKGNVVDPLDTVRDFGADSLRYSLVTGVTPGQDIPLNMEKIKANRNFANKLWNCCKFVTGNALNGLNDEELESLAVNGPMGKEEFDNLSLPEKYIISKCHELVAEVTRDIEGYQIGAAGSQIYEFLWDQFADWYIEISKTRLYEGAGGGGITELRSSRRVLVYVLDTSLRLLHPYMPYVTEKLWHHLPRTSKAANRAVNALMLADWPQMDDGAPLPVDDGAVAAFKIFQVLTKAIRNARAEYNVEPGKRIAATVVAREDVCEFLTPEIKSLVFLAKLDPDLVQVVQVGSEEAAASAAVDSVKVVIQDGIEVFLPLSGLIDPVKERQRLERKATKLEKDITKLTGQLKSAGFVEKAPPALVEKARKELAELEDQASKIQTDLQALL